MLSLKTDSANVRTILDSTYLHVSLNLSMCRAIASKSIYDEFISKLTNCRGETWLALTHTA